MGFLDNLGGNIRQVGSELASIFTDASKVVDEPVLGDLATGALIGAGISWLNDSDVGLGSVLGGLGGLTLAGTEYELTDMIFGSSERELEILEEQAETARVLPDVKIPEVTPISPTPGEAVPEVTPSLLGEIRELKEAVAGKSISEIAGAKKGLTEKQQEVGLSFIGGAFKSKREQEAAEERNALLRQQIGRPKIIWPRTFS